ncbi:MAG: AraC family transcriptional regulator [Clostridiales bacterium]|nr:AraC family transcriptional regulator [Clostridiales bacterium]
MSKSVSDIISAMNLNVLTDVYRPDEMIEKGYAGDMLSHVMAHLQTGECWFTILNSMNVIAVASLNECPLVILTEDVVLQEPVMEKAKMEEICVCNTSLDTYSACAVLQGILDTGEV